METQQKDILADSHAPRRSRSESESESSPEPTRKEVGGGGRASLMSPNTLKQRKKFASNNQPRERKAHPPRKSQGREIVSPKRIPNPGMSLSRVGLPPLTKCRPFEPIDPKRGLVWFRMTRTSNGRKFSLIDTKVSGRPTLVAQAQCGVFVLTRWKSKLIGTLCVGFACLCHLQLETPLLVAEQKKLLAFDYEIRYGLGMRQLCLDEGASNPALGMVKMVDPSRLRCVWLVYGGML